MAVQLWKVIAPGAVGVFFATLLLAVWMCVMCAGNERIGFSFDWAGPDSHLVNFAHPSLHFIPIPPTSLKLHTLRIMSAHSTGFLLPDEAHFGCLCLPHVFYLTCIHSFSILVLDPPGSKHSRPNTQHTLSFCAGRRILHFSRVGMERISLLQRCTSFR